MLPKRVASPRSLMASLGSLPFLRPKPLSFSSPSPSTGPNPNPNHRFLPVRAIFRTRADGESSRKWPPRRSPAGEKKSLAVATGELFLGLASLLLRSRSSAAPVMAPPGDPEVLPDREKACLSGEGESIASVVKDPVDQEVLWEQRLKDVEAEKERKKETTPLAGSSAGAIVCVVIASGNSMQDALQATKLLAEDCRVKGTAFRLGAVLRDVLIKFLPEDVHIRSNGRVRVAVTQLFWRPKGLLVDQFDSKEDLINAVFTSSFIPGYVAPRPATIFRNRLCIDGGLTLFMPPTFASETVRVCAFPANRLGLNGIGISPHCNPENRATTRQLFNWALEPAEDYILDKLYELGYLDAAVWAEQNPVESTVKEGSISSRIVIDAGSTNGSQIVKDAGSTNGSHIVEDEGSSNSM
ncbi:uncharacterized protein [Elaeis guineensis]|uniref:Patatin n=1 Tax=Elaeis guineensis var. tenera TaxID=51953 RepID=A0A6I9QXB2_ELAGV|nr:uncharacterized protein LOC105041320 isoform X2 [Elaeis guineensis]